MVPLKNQSHQYLISILSVAVVSLLGLAVRDIIDYKIIGYLLLFLVSILAIFLEIRQVLLAAILSAVALDFLFIKPYYTLHIDNAQDALLLLLFFIIALINAVLTYKIKRMQKAIHMKEARVNTMKLYNTLLDSLSHELRTPIATIIGSIDTLQQKNVNLTADSKDNLFNEIEKASMKLNYQVENLLNMSRLESGYILPKSDWCDVKELAYNACNRLSEELKGHKWTILADDNLPLFKLDYGLMEQILYNLIYNASQYTPKGAKIQIEIKYDVDADYEAHMNVIKKCIITIADDGYGFPEAEIDRAFDKFYRLQNSKTGGTGLGLSIVKGFVEAQNGTIKLSNAEEGGAVFEMTFAVDCLATNTVVNE
ncbi:PAS domain-containing sensor histidine kinase [Flavobacterium silvisoli]|uniref:histidine kinase n=1 Tax=Flavobacterium silvisoli TaxID=2529433 RepID=A0A4Q9Z0K4_9FLAO|nr:ATP-binding protein [Flavobacterium silvisoli]TBX68703.1 PAS domain-containing sensor histidine kinase [Flavobacterium silvisoli]